MNEKKKRKKSNPSTKQNHSGATKRKRLVLEEGQIIKKYEILKFIKFGGFCDIYEVRDITSEKHYAMKIEPLENKYLSLKHEKKIYQTLSDSKRFPYLVEYIETDGYLALIIELLGCSLHNIRRVLGLGCVPRNTSLRIALEMLRCLDDLHQKGVMHRDVKPQNFLIRPLKRFPVALVDFGHSFIYKDERGNLIRKDSFKFAGTPPYCTPELLGGSAPTLRDDYFGWILSVIEMLNGNLPWFELENKEEISEAINKEDGSTFRGYIPDEIIEIFLILKENDLDDSKKEKIHFLLEKSIENNFVEWDDTYIWEEIPTEDILLVSPIPLRPSLYTEPIPHNKEQAPRGFFYVIETQPQENSCCPLI